MGRDGLGAMLGALLVVLGGAMLAAQNQDFSKVQITTEKLGSGAVHADRRRR